MPEFQDARNGLDALLKDAKGNLTPSDRDKAIVDAARAYSRRRPRLLSVEVAGDGGFDYALPTGWVDGFSTMRNLLFPWVETDQDPPSLEPKDFCIFDKPSGTVLRFKVDRPDASQKFLAQFTAPHTATSTGADTNSELDAAGRVVAGSGITSTAAIDTSGAADIQVFINVSAAAGTLLSVIIETSEDGTNWSEAGSFRRIKAAGNFVRPVPKEQVSKFIRLVYTTTGGSFTLGATLTQENAGATLTIPDHTFDAFVYLAASIAAQSLADFYSHFVDSQLEGETTDYEGKAVFWQENSKNWDAKWEKEIAKAGPRRGTSAFKQGEWDLVGSTKYPMLTHYERHR